MSREALIRANEALLARRKALGTDRIRLIEPAVNSVAARNGMTIQDYFQALRAGRPTGNELETVETSRLLWDSFNSDRHPQLQVAIKTIKKWWIERIEQGGAIILAGGCGCGKTHLARAIYQMFGYGAIYWSELDYVKAVQSGYGGGRNEEQLIANCRRAKLLIYDDLGAYATDNAKWMQGIYYRLFDGRAEEGRATFITTNLPRARQLAPDTFFSPLEDWVGARVYSRLIGALGSTEFYVNLFDVPDYRRRDW